MRKACRDAASPESHDIGFDAVREAPVCRGFSRLFKQDTHLFKQDIFSTLANEERLLLSRIRQVPIPQPCKGKTTADEAGHT